MFPDTRMRRCRRTEGLRALSRESVIEPEHLILPLFVVAGSGRQEPVASMPGVSRVSVDVLRRQANEFRVCAVLLFGVPEESDKDECGSAALREDGIVPQALRALKAERPEVVAITDVCLCAYTSHGHCGVLSDSGELENDSSLEQLSRMAATHAAAGADMVAPSAMTDGQVQAIRASLDAAAFRSTAIMSYAAKFASGFYGPFREAARSAPKSGDRRSYQLPPHNRREAIRDALLDEQEGADWLMVKPALPYLDVLAELRSTTRLPIAAYQVSGEYCMLKYAAQAGVLDERSAALEAVLCIVRAGADAVVTYYAEAICRWIGR